MDIISIAMLVAMLLVFYFLLIRPENKRKKETAAMLKSLEVGDLITTIGGVIGTICAVKEESVVIEVGEDRVRIEFTKSAVASKEVQSATSDESKDSKETKE